MAKMVGTNKAYSMARTVSSRVWLEPKQVVAECRAGHTKQKN